MAQNEGNVIEPEPLITSNTPSMPVIAMVGATAFDGDKGTKARQVLWEATFETFYDCGYNENVADLLVDRWQRVDEVARTLVAITASTSAVAGWTLWNEPGFKNVWGGLAGVAALLSIIHTTLGVAGRIREWIGLKRSFASLRVELETFRYLMRVDRDFDVAKFSQSFADYRRRYVEVVQRLNNDILLTKRLKLNAQQSLDERLQKNER